MSHMLLSSLSILEEWKIPKYLVNTTRSTPESEHVPFTAVQNNACYSVADLSWLAEKQRSLF